jgi:hypothetical protein
MAAIPDRPALHPLTADDRGSLIIIIAYTFICITVLAAAIRFGLAWSHRLRLKRDDFSFAAGVVRMNLFGRSRALLTCADTGFGELGLLPHRQQQWTWEENGQSASRRL